MSITATAFKRRRSWLVEAALAVIWCVSGVDAHTLRIRVQPGRAQGGQAFEEQPQVEILEGDGGDVDVLFQVSLSTTIAILVLALYWLASAVTDINGVWRRLASVIGRGSRADVLYNCAT